MESFWYLTSITVLVVVALFYLLHKRQKNIRRLNASKKREEESAKKPSFEYKVGAEGFARRMEIHYRKR